MAKANEPLTFLSDYIYQKMTSSTFDSESPVEQSATFRIAAHLALQEQSQELTAGKLTSGDLNTSQGDEPECNEPGAGGAPSNYEYQDENNTPGVQEFDGPDCDPHGDEVVYATEANLMYAGFAQYNMRVLAAMGVDPEADSLDTEEHGEEATVSPSPMGTGSSPVEFQDSVEVDPEMGPAATPGGPVGSDEPSDGVPEEVYSEELHSEPELPTGTQPKKPAEPVVPVEPVQPVEPKQAASTRGAPTLKETAARVLQAEKWSSDVKTEWHPPEGFFEGSAEKIAKGLKRESSGLQQAMSRLNFYINRAGSNLSAEDKSRLEHAKDVLHDLYGTEKGS